jgi:hypothetical protein
VDFIDEFVSHSAGLPTPELFRLWGGISAIGGLLERRCWTVTAQAPLFPNMFVVLVGPPAVGKSVLLSQVTKFWRKIDKIHIAPDDVTGASLLDALASAPRNIVQADGSLLDYHSLLVASSELGVLLPEYDSIMIALLCHLYDNPPRYEQNRRTNNRRLDITAPHINILAGCTPGYLARAFPEMAWTTGFSSRMTMIYAAAAPKVPIFTKTPVDLVREARMLAHLAKVMEMSGEFTWTDDAVAAIERWALGDLKPIPTHSKLQTYNGRRGITAIKLCMISAASRCAELLVEQIDFERAQAWLLEAETMMPDIFRDMNGRSDTDVIEELHFFLWKRWVAGKQSTHESAIYHFLSQKLPSEKIPRLIDTAERMNMMTREAGTQMWIPKPKHEHGME